MWVPLGMAATTRPLPSTNSDRPEVPTQVLYLFVSLIIVVGVSLAGRSWTDTGTGSWYNSLSKPPITPPGAVFGIAWGLLYLAIGVAAFLVAREGMNRSDVRQALAFYVVQLVLNLGWTFIFFRAERPGWALVEIVILLVAAGLTAVKFRPISRPAAGLFVPYLGWLTFATVLTMWFCVKNS